LATLRKNLEEIEKEAETAPADKLDDLFKTVMTVSFFFLVLFYSLLVIYYF